MLRLRLYHRPSGLLNCGQFVGPAPAVDGQQIPDRGTNVADPAFHTRQTGDHPATATPGCRDGEHRLTCQATLFAAGSLAAAEDGR